MKRILCLIFAVALFLVSCKKEEPDPNMVASAGDFSIYIAENGFYNVRYNSKISDIYLSKTRNFTPSLCSIDFNKDEKMDAMLIEYQLISRLTHGQKISFLVADESDSVEKIDCPLTVKDLNKQVSFRKQDQSTIVVTVGEKEHFFAVLDNDEFESGELDEKIEYSVVGEEIIATTRVGLRFKGQAHSSKYGYIDATVEYKNNKFSFTNVTYRKY